jgi:hypothetical protein
VWDLVVGLCVVALVSTAAFVAGDVVAKKASRAVAVAAAVSTIVAGGLYVFLVRDCVWVLKLIPLSNAVVLANWLPVAAGLLAGIAWRLIPGKPLRRCWPVIALGFAGLFALFQPLLGRPPACHNVWDDDGICRQTSQRTCSAACAATLLRFHGIDATEQEMAELCLSRKGTTWRGMYRGLKLKTAKSPFSVSFRS